MICQKEKKKKIERVCMGKKNKKGGAVDIIVYM